jgi:hypothetical protein
MGGPDGELVQPIFHRLADRHHRLVLVAYKFDVAPFWIGIGALLLVGVGIITSVKHSKPRI